MFNEHAAGALRVERALHGSFFREFGLSPEDVAATPLAPTNLAYTSYLLTVANTAPFHEAISALLPCYWIYWEVGKELEQAGSPDPL
jgi:thiaminase (transcriptional activator TenA)